MENHIFLCKLDQVFRDEFDINYFNRNRTLAFKKLKLQCGDAIYMQTKSKSRPLLLRLLKSTLVDIP